MGFIFNSVADVAVFLVLIAICFGSLFMGGGMRAYGRDRWYQSISKRIWGMPPWWVFPLVWTAMYLLIVVSFYLVYQSADSSGAFGLAVDALTLLFAFNIGMNKLWSTVFFGMRQSAVALALVLGILATCAIILYFMWSGGYTNSFWIFFAYPVWCCYALYLNAAWVYYQYRFYRKSE